MLKFHEELKFESLHCSLQAVWTAKTNAISVSSQELLPRKVKARCSPDVLRQGGPESRPQPLLPSPGQAGQTGQQEGHWSRRVTQGLQT